MIRITGVLFMMLFFTGVAVGCAVDIEPEPDTDTGCMIVSGTEARELFDANEQAILLDVRNQSEYDDGHIDGSVLIPVAELESRLSDLPDKDAVIIVYCRSGNRSKTACDILTSNGYKNVYDMQQFDNWVE
jgi:rhodanese-related sulfurtransferase